MRQHSIKLHLLILAVIAAALRLIGLGAKQLWVDEIIQVLHSRPDSIKKILAGVAQDRGGAPLDYLIQHLFISTIPGPIEWIARLHAAILGIISVLLIYYIAKELLENHLLSFICALLFCFYPFHQHYSQDGRPYSLFVFFALILQLIVLRSLKTNRGRIWILFAVIAALSFYAYPYTAALLFAQFLFLTIHALSMNEEGGRKTARRRIGYFLASAIAAAAAYLPWQLYSFSNAQGEAPPQMGIRLVLQMIKGLGDGSYPLAATLLLFAAIGIRSLQKEKRSIALWALLSWLLAPLPMIVIVLYWRNYFFAERQLLFITPALIILAAIGADWARKQLSLKRYQPEAVIILISLAVIGLHYPDRQDDLKGAARFLKENVRPSDVIIAPNLMGVLSLYYPEIWEHAESKPSHSRIIYLDSRFNNNRQELEALIDSSKQRKEISFRGIKIIYFFEPGEKETEVAASTAETGDSELF